MIHGTIATSRIRGNEDRPADTRHCYRCGIQWRDSQVRWKPTAPCRDCRDILLDDGVDVVAEFAMPEKRHTFDTSSPKSIYRRRDAA